MRRPGIRPVVWSPPQPPQRARAGASSPPMADLRLLELGTAGPEDVLADADGTIVTGVADGRLLRVDPVTGTVRRIADTGGRPLGVEAAGDGRLIVCDAQRGLLRVDPGTGAIEVLVSEVAGEPLRLCNNAAVAADGTIYFSDSSRRFGLDHWRADLMEHGGTGRLLRRDTDGTVTVLADGLQFSNGVALAADESFVAVAETGSYRVNRVWLTGPRAGQRDVLADNLPGIPDNMSTGADGLLWIALASPRNRLLDWAHRRPPVLRRVVWALPEALQPPPAPTSWVIAVDGTGAVVHDLQRSEGGYQMVTGVRAHAGSLYLGSLTESAIAVLPLPS